MHCRCMSLISNLRVVSSVQQERNGVLNLGTHKLQMRSFRFYLPHSTSCPFVDNANPAVEELRFVSSLFC
jgi:hypothetical protein